MLVIAAMAAFGAFAGGEFSHNGCTAKWTDDVLTVGNGLFSREYAQQDGVLRTRSFKANQGGEWQDSARTAQGGEKLNASAAKSKWSPVGAEGVRITVRSDKAETTIDIYPDMPGVIVSRSDVVVVGPEHDLERDFDRHRERKVALERAAASCDAIAYRPRHVKLTSVICADQTDSRDNLVAVDERLLMDYDWIFCTHGAFKVTPTDPDPVIKPGEMGPLGASSPKVLPKMWKMKKPFADGKFDLKVNLAEFGLKFEEVAQI